MKVKMYGKEISTVTGIVISDLMDKSITIEVAHDRLFIRNADHPNGKFIEFKSLLK